MNLSHCRACGAVLRVELLPGWGEEPVKHECIAPCHQCEPAGECQARTPCRATTEPGGSQHGAS